jgi:hypothetical protein
LAYTLKTYSLSIYASIWSDAKNILSNKNLTKPEKAEILARLKGQLAVQVLLGGAFSTITPISFLTLNLISAAMSAVGADDDEFDWTLDSRIPEERIEQYVREKLGANQARLLTGGIPKLLGVDIRNNVQQDWFFRSQIIPAVGDRALFEEKFNETLPVISVLQSLYNSGSSLVSGDLTQAVKDLGQRGVGGAFRAGNLINNDGLIMTKNGRIIADLGENAFAPVLVGLGFTPTAASEGQRRRGNEMLVGRQYNEAKRVIEDAAYAAVRFSEINGDNSAQEAVEVMVEKFNEKYAEGDSKIALNYEKIIQSSLTKAKQERDRFYSKEVDSGNKGRNAYLKRELGTVSDNDDD